MNTVIPWSFVTAVAAKLRADTMMGLTGFHGTTFVHETNLKIFVTVTAEGFMLPATAL